MLLPVGHMQNLYLMTADHTYKEMDRVLCCLKTTTSIGYLVLGSENKGT